MKNKVKLALSGFCVAREAADNYYESINKNNGLNFKEAIDKSARENIFKTDTMKNGIEALLLSLGFSKNYINEDFLKFKNEDWLFTQMLCCITVNGHSKAGDVLGCIKKMHDVRKFAQFSLERWCRNLFNHVKKGSCILIMGNDAEELLKMSKINICGSVSIEKSDISKENDSLYKCLGNNFKLLFVVHAAALAPIHDWITKKRFEVNEKLKKSSQIDSYISINDLSNLNIVPNGIALAQLMREASKKNLFFHIENPAEWQREIRKERVLPGRNSASDDSF